MENDMDLLKKQLKENIQKLIDANALEEAKALVEQYKNIAINDAEAYSMDAVILIMENKFAEAEEVLREGLNIDESNFDLNYNLAYIYEHKKDLKQALWYYNKSLYNCDNEDMSKEINEIINTIQQEHSIKTIENKKKIAFFVKQGMDSFLNDIINGISGEYETEKIVVTDFKQIDEGMQWADACWFEWCDELVIYGSNLPMAKEKKIICRLHSYEAFTDYPSKVNWNTVDKLVFVAEHIKNFVTDKFNINNEKVAVIPNGIDINKWTFKERKPGFNIAYVGYINYKKGPMLLLHTFKAIYDKNHRYKLYIAGKFQDDRDVLYFNQMIKEFGIEKNIVYEGWKDNLDEWLEDKNYILCTSILESQNMSVMQAMVKGIKPIVHNFVGAKTIYPKEYVWNTIDEAVSNLRSGEYNSYEYNDFIKQKYSLEKQTLSIINLLESIEKSIIKDPLVTVGILSYNYANYLQESIDSVLNQSYKNIEILVVDDFSTDGSRKIIENYEKKYKNIRGIYHDKNSGNAVKGFQEIIKESNGKYFTLLSADDFFADKNVIERYAYEFLLDEQLDYVYGNIKLYGGLKNKNEIWRYRDYSDDEIIYEIFRRKGSGVIPFSTGLFKTEFYRKNNLTWIEDKNNRVAGDTLNTLINIKYGWKRKHLDYNTICYRQHNNNMTYDLKNRIKSIISVMEYIINNFSEKIYLKDASWENLNLKLKKSKKAYLIGLNYYEAFIMYLNGQGMPWQHNLDFDSEQIKEFLQPLIDVSQKYLRMSLANSNIYANNINEVLKQLNKYKIDISINKNTKEYILQNEIVCTGNNLRRNLLDKYKNKYNNSNVTILIYSPLNGYWKYSFLSWKSVLNYMGIKVDIVYEINMNLDYSVYNTFITIGEGFYINNSLKNQSIRNIKDKIGIASKQNNNIRADLENIQLCKRFEFKFLISSMTNEANKSILSSWIESNINIVSIPFGFNPLINYPELTKKVYDYFFVGSNSYLKIGETKKYLLSILNNYENGILRGSSWGNSIQELEPKNSTFFYNRAKINLNYHLNIQKEFKNEINERTFIIGACGGFQLVDNPKLIFDVYTEDDLAIASDQYEYIEKFEYYLNKPLDRLEKSYNILITTYKNDYSLFNRLENILKLIV